MPPVSSAGSVQFARHNTHGVHCILREREDCVYNAVVARPRVIIAAQDAKVAVKIISALNPKRYRVEHLLDWSEALLRADLVLAHTVVIHAPKMSSDLMRRCEQSAERAMTMVFLSDDAELAKAVEQFDGRVESFPIHRATLKRTVFRAVADAHALRGESGKQQLPRRQSGTLPLQRIMVLMPDATHAEIMAAVLRSRLRVSCPIATSAAAALEMLEEELDCILATPPLLMMSSAGARLAQQLAKMGTPVLPLQVPVSLDVTTAGEIAWDLIPRLRRTLAARATPRILNMRPNFLDRRP